MKTLFPPILGNPSIQEKISHLLEKKMLPSALLFTGPEGVGKKLLAQQIVKYLLGSSSLQHPDLHWYQPEGKQGLYKMDKIREIVEEVYKPPFQANQKIFVLEQAEKMQPVAANALLKTLEEPTLDSYFILITSHSSQMLPTLLSRLTPFLFSPLTAKEIEEGLISQHQVAPKEAKEVAHSAQGSFSQALSLVQFPNFLELRTLLLTLLMKKFQSLDEFYQVLEEIEQKLTEKKELEIDWIFSHIYLWYRDLSLLKDGISQEKLSFIETFDFYGKDKKIPSLVPLEQWLEKASQAYQRGTRLSYCLEYLSIQLELV